MNSYGFVKIYGSKLITSSLWDEPPEARLTFFGLLAIADFNGVVDVPSERTLARVLNLPEDYIERAMAVLEAPDPRSRTKTSDGRRVVRLDPTGWQVVNFAQYRDFRSPKQLATNKRVAAWREKHRVPEHRPTRIKGTKAEDAAYNLHLMANDIAEKKAR